MLWPILTSFGKYMTHQILLRFIEFITIKSLCYNKIKNLIKFFECNKIKFIDFSIKIIVEIYYK